MSLLPRPSVTGLALLSTAILAGPFVDAAVARTDWDLYSMRLVNRARQDPAGEAARIGSAVTDSTPPRPPLAYAPNVADAAHNHTDWMHDNLGSITGSCFPDSFTHRETLNCSSSGTPATGTPSYTGASAGDRITFAGYPWSAWGENIFVTWSTANISVSKSRIDSNHLWWWESTGHRSNFLSSNFASYGHHIETRPFTPPLGGLNPPFDNLQYTTQNFSRPASAVRTHILGLLYDDLDRNGEWTPRDTGHAMREGLGGIVVDVLGDGTGMEPPIASATSDDTGAFAIIIPDGLYDVAIRFPSGDVLVPNVQVVGANVDIGDHIPGPSTCPGDLDGNGGIGFADLNILLGQWGTCPAPPADCSGDLDGDDNVGFTDLSDLLNLWGPC